MRKAGCAKAEVEWLLLLSDVLNDFIIMAIPPEENTTNFSRVFTITDISLRSTLSRFLFEILMDERSQKLIGSHNYNGQRYFTKESFEEFLGWIFGVKYCELLKGSDTNTYLSSDHNGIILKAFSSFYSEVVSMSSASGYILPILLDYVKEAAAHVGEE